MNRLLNRDRIDSRKKIVIYGAHLVALECFRYLERRGLKESIIGFAVSEMTGNPRDIDGIPVRRIQEYQQFSKETTVVIAMPERYHLAVEQYARKYGFYEFVKVSLETMSEIRGSEIVLAQKDVPRFSFQLEKSLNDPTWLDMSVREEAGILRCKFPTLFYLEEDKVIEEASKLKLKNEYEKALGDYRNIHDLITVDDATMSYDDLASLMRIYMAFSEKDISMVRDREYSPWICPLQVGSKNAKERYGKNFDESRENISDKNALFAEMTGVYWIWKMLPETEYTGLCHYRRHFILAPEEIAAMKGNAIDVLLTTPRYVPGGIRNMFVVETPVKEPVFDSMLAALDEKGNAEKEGFKNYIQGNFYFPNNMVVAKNEIYKDYCAWIFPVLFRMLELDMESGYGHFTDRHIAYAAELLTSYFFARHKDDYCIAVTDYKFFS